MMVWRSKLWERVCSRKRPGSRPFSFRCTYPSGVHIRCCGNGHLGFRPYGDSLFLQAPKKSKQKIHSPRRPAPRLGSVFLRSGIHLGASPPVCFATTSSRCVRLRRTALRACPPDECLHSACRRGGWIKIKSRRATARPVEWWGAKRGRRSIVGAGLPAIAA